MTLCLSDTKTDPMPHPWLAPAQVMKSEQASQAAYERDHRIAESLQRVLLRTHPQEKLLGLLTDAFYEAALGEAAVGGDSFDAFPLSGGRAALVVLDASGKGLAAAERVAEIRFALRAFLREHNDPGQALSRLNDFVCDAQRLGQRDPSTFATLTLIILNGTSGEMSCLCAGGEPPLVLRAGGTVELVQICGAALGLFPAQGYAAAPLRLDMGDVVLLTTDGITEARSLNPVDPTGSRVGPFLGLGGLARLAVQAQGSERVPQPEIGRSIFDGARQYAGGLFHDDACLLVGRRETA